MRKKLQTAALALLMIISLALPLGAWAEEKTWDVTETGSMLLYRLSTWDDALPQELAKALSDAGYGAFPCISGAMFQVVDKRNQKVESTMALVTLKGDAGPIALGITQGAETGQWYLDDMGAKAFLPGQDFTVQVFMTHERLPRFHFSIDYAEPKGGTVRYHFAQNRGLGQAWIMAGYSAWDAQGKGLWISSDKYGENGFRVRQLPAKDKDEGVFYQGFINPIIRYMPVGALDYPTTQEEARRIAQESLGLFEGKNLAIVYGANLREKPTVRSRSLGMGQAGALAYVLGQEKGKDYPWIHLRLGDVEGYMSGVYVKQLKDADAFFAESGGSEAFSAMPPPLARAKAACVLRKSPGGHGKEVSPLPAGTRMHVLSFTADGYYQVMVPRGEPGWMMDLEGTSGYVKADEVEVISGRIKD